MTQMCQARFDAMQEPIHYPSKSDPHGKGYSVYLFRSEKSGKVQPDMCTCRPFLNGRSKAAKAAGIPADQAFFECQHIKDAKAKTCAWTENDPPGFQYGDECPKCKGPLHNDVVPPPAKPGTSNLSSLEEARRLSAELKGEKYVPLGATTDEDDGYTGPGSVASIGKDLDEVDAFMEAVDPKGLARLDQIVVEMKLLVSEAEQIVKELRA